MREPRRSTILRENPRLKKNKSPLQRTVHLRSLGIASVHARLLGQGLWRVPHCEGRRSWLQLVPHFAEIAFM